MNALEVRHLCKSFGELKAVDDVSFGVPEGSVFGLIGRNGAGKTTTIRMMMNVFGPDSGEILFKGQRTGEEFRRKVSYLPEERGLYKKMKVIDLLNFFLEIRGIDPRAVRQKVGDYLDRFSLGDRQQAKIEDLSKGNQQKIQFIAAILSDPDVLVLDEPFSGLDPVNAGLLKDIVMDLKQQGKVIIFSTHLMELAERMCDQIALIHKGKLVLNGSLGSIKQKYSQRNVTLVHEGDIAFLHGHPLVESVNAHGNVTGIRMKRAEDVQALLRLLVEHDIAIKRFDANDISLQEIFLEVAGDKAADADPLFATLAGA
jgi:ABC-2 type transport system ATP-binding protein